MAVILDVRNVTCGYKNNIVLENVSFTAASGQVICILGPNGVGKTTVFKTIMGVLKPMSGEILIDNRNRMTMNEREIAQLVAYVPQYHTPPFPFLVKEVVATGRTAHLKRFSSPGKKDEDIVNQVLESMDMVDFADRVYTELSGGERQMVLIARALAQQPKLMILDEPTSNLDFGNQVKVLKKITDLSKDGLSIVMVSHFPDHAFMCDAEVLLFQKNKPVIRGSSAEIITQQNVLDAYGINSRITEVVDDNGYTVRACIPLVS